MWFRTDSFNNTAPKPTFSFKQQLNISALRSDGRSCTDLPAVPVPPRFDLEPKTGNIIQQWKGNMVAQGLNCPSRKRLKRPKKVGSNPKLSAANFSYSI